MTHIIGNPTDNIDTRTSLDTTGLTPRQIHLAEIALRRSGEDITGELRRPHLPDEDVNVEQAVVTATDPDVSGFHERRQERLDTTPSADAREQYNH